MDIAKILVVEDEGIIAQDIKNCLENLGYEVPEVVYTGNDAIIKAEELRPDLVLMDIVLKGEIDGIETASEIRKRYNIPIVYLTAYEDEKTLRRAKITEPHGYILKPFEERYLRSSIEMALYKHKMENKLKNNERWLAAILKSVGDGVIVADSNLFVKYLNPVAESLTGWEFSESIGKKLDEIFQLLDEDTLQKKENPAVKAISHNTIVGHTNHAILVSKEGSTIPIDDTAAPMRDDEGNVTGVVLVFNDITNRKKAEETIRENEKKYRDLFDNAGEAIFVLAYSGDVLSVNNAGCSLLGFSRDEFLKMNLKDIIEADFYEIFLTEAQKLREKETFSAETRHKKKNGEWIDVEFRINVINFINEQAVQVFVRDITKLKETQKQINMLAQAVKSISECVSITGLDDRIIYINEAFEKTYGYTFEELKNKTLNIIRSQKNPSVLHHHIYNHTLRGGWQGELINRSRDGREFPINLSTSLIRNEKGDPIAMMGIAMDISERKKLENALRDSEKDYKGLFENAHDAILIFRPDDEIILDVNQRAAEIYGYTKEEFVGMTLDTLSKNSNEINNFFRQIKEGNLKTRYETVHFRKDGTAMDLEINSSIVNYKGLQSIVCINRDVTDRKKYEKELLDSNARKTAILESSPDAILSVNSNGIISEWNRSAENIFGYKGLELKNENIEVLLLNESDKLKIQKELKAIAEGNFRSKLIIVNTVSKFGKLIPAEVSLTKIKLKDSASFLITIRDITERVLAEEAVKISEARYRYVAKATNDAVWDLDLKSNKVEWNEGLQILFGYPDNKDNNDRSWWVERLHPEDKDRVKASIEKTVQNKEQLWSDEYKFRCNDGKYAYVIDRGYVLYNERNEPVRMIGCMTDMTKRKLAEFEAIEREKQYRNLAESAPIAVTRIDMETKDYEFVNEEFVRQSGYTMEEYNQLTSEELVDIIHPDDKEKVFEFYKEWSSIKHKGTQHIDYRIINRRKEVLWLDTYLFADFDNDNKVKAINQICIDITEQKKAQEKVNKSEKRFRSLIDNSSDMIALTNAEGKILYASPSTERILGYKIDEILGKKEFDFVHKDDLYKVQELYDTILRTDGETATTTFRSWNKSGAAIWIETTATNLISDPDINAIVLNYRDITERKKAEDEILLQKSYFQQLFENSPEAIVIMDNEDKIVDVNTGFEKLFQYSREELESKNVNNLIVPDEYYEKSVQMSLFVKSGEIIHNETVRKRKDGSLVDVSLLAYPITLGKDQIGVYGIYSDISARKQTEKALKNSEERYRVFVKQSTEGIWRFEFLEPINIKLPMDEQIDRAFKFGFMAECNDSMARMYGFNSAEEIIGIQLSKLLPKSDPFNVEHLKKFMSNNYRISESESHELDKKGNSKYFVNNLLGIVENNHLVRVWGTQRDVTMNKLAELELHKIQSRLTTLLSNLPDVVLYETGGETEFITDNVINLLGYPAKNFEDKTFFNKLVHPGDNIETTRRIKEWADNGHQGILNLEFRCRRADGEYIWIEDHMVSIKEHERQILAGVMLDITGRKRSEEKLKTMADKLASSNKELEQFAYVASHDLQEPLRMVASYIQLLQRRYSDKLGDDANEFIDYAVDGVIRMKALINDLLIYSRVNTREMPLEDVDTNATVERAIENLKASIDDNKAQIVYSGLPVIKANTLQLSQLFQNLISNAIKFHGAENPIVEINAKESDNEWLFTVKDNGIGIDKEYTDKIFEIFQRLHNYKEYPGTGIGLAICKKIVEKLGGNIWVESEPGTGSTFYFTLPSSNKNGQ